MPKVVEKYASIPKEFGIHELELNLGVDGFPIIRPEYLPHADQIRDAGFGLQLPPYDQMAEWIGATGFGVEHLVAKCSPLLHVDELAGNPLLMGKETTVDVPTSSDGKSRELGMFLPDGSLQWKVRTNDGKTVCRFQCTQVLQIDGSTDTLRKVTMFCRDRGDHEVSSVYVETTDLHKGIIYSQYEDRDTDGKIVVAKRRKRKVGEDIPFETDTDLAKYNEWKAGRR